MVSPSSAWFSDAAFDVTVVNWQLKGNKGISPSTNFLGTTDNNALVIRTNNVEALRVLSGSGTTEGNVEIGTRSPAFALDVHGDINTSTKYDLGGTPILQTPGGNTLVGFGVGSNIRPDISATGPGCCNTASGYLSLSSNTTGTFNVAMGYEALQWNTSGGDNIAFGDGALYSNSAGSGNVASGSAALNYNTSGSSNVAVGDNALQANTTGDYNTAIGIDAGEVGNPANANTTGSYNTFLGYLSGPGTAMQLTNSAAVGANVLVSESNALVLGGIGANAVSDGIGTASPHSTLQVTGNYVQLPTIAGSAPPAGDCASATDAGRMVARTDGPTNLYICTGIAGWVSK